MNTWDETNILKMIDETGLLSQLESMTIKEFRKHLDKKGCCSLTDILTISLLVYGFLTGKGLVFFKDTEEDKELKDVRFSYKYNLTIDEISTLKMMAKGLTNQEIADKLNMITVDGVAKRVEKIKKKLSVENRIQASVKAAKQGLI